MTIPDTIRKKLRQLPDKPGCYMMRDTRGRIIYVGKAVSLRKRVQSYFRQATLRSGSPKLRGLIKSIHDFDYIVVRNEAEALLTESRLIKDYKPRYNVAFRDDKRFLMLKADPDKPFPHLSLCRLKRDDGAFYFGPYTSAHTARATLDFTEKKFGLRKCTPHIPTDETYKHCLNDIIRYCSAPCVGKIDRDAYRKSFEEACRFLRGDRPDLLKDLTEVMEAAARAMDFERAAALRDTLFTLRSAVKQKNRIAATPEMKRQEATRGVEELREVLKLGSTPHIIEGYDISNISGTYAVASMVCFIDGMPQRNRYRRFRIKTVQGIDDPGMMAEVIRRRFTRAGEEGGALPDLVMVDGGLTQKNAARTVLDELGLAELPVVGLAKRMEELYWHENAPIRLDRDHKALQVLQRLRDEAHRFALTYHHHLRSERIRESALDDIEGIGKIRKQLLLQRFGSVRRLMSATEDDIAAVPGIGLKMAHMIKERLGQNTGSES